ncbi:MAG TPA: mannose-1-phosphate guanylyltransferase [Gemmatimonadaceae bacterium]|nr:mannose-1-phosphate guanylyltransferase [Gemmatimonadaceae bacterium]
MSRWGVILAGGIGSRFWPLSTQARPKQLLPLVDSDPLLVNTLRRLSPIIPAEQTLVLTTRPLREAIAAAAPDLPVKNIIAEPRPVGTAGALAWAAVQIARRDGENAVMICVHSDWAIGDDNAFRESLLAAERVAIEEGALVTVGVVPTRADPGFGYIQTGAATETGALAVSRFVEKPTRERAERMLHQGYLWNSGIFVWRVADFLAEVRALTPEVSGALADAGGAGDVGGHDAGDRFFRAVTPVSVDVGVLERSSKVRVLPGDFGWDDVGTWGSLRRVKAEDETGNVSSGSVYAVEAVGNVVHAEEGTVVLYGVNDLVVVTKAGVTLVTTTDRSADLKALVDSLPEDLRDPA